jgi:hypothetical protein
MASALDSPRVHMVRTTMAASSQLWGGWEAAAEVNLSTQVTDIVKIF